MPTSHGTFAWHELNTTDPEAAKAFYPEVARWKTQPMDDMPDYTLWTNNGAPIGGMTALPDELRATGVAPHWLAYVRVYDLDDCLRQAKALGGQVRWGPKEVPNVGCWAVIADPQGAVIGVYEPVANDPAPLGPPSRGEFSWHELLTTDYQAAWNFYRTLFRWESIGEFDMGPMGLYHTFGQKGVTYGGMFNRGPDMPLPNWLSYVRVDDVTPAAETVHNLGGKVMYGPASVPGGDQIAQVMDPQGATFALHTLKAPLT